MWSAHRYSDALNVVGPFPRSDWEEPLGLFISTVMVPRAGAPTGASPDFASGPIFDMHVRDKDGNGWDAAVPFTIRE